MEILSLFALFCHFCMFHGDDEFTLIAINVSSRKRTMTTFMPYNTSHTSHSSHCESRYQGRNAIFDMFMHHTHGDHSQANASELNTHNNAALLLFAFISLSKSTQLQHMLAVFIALNFVGSRAAYYVFESTAMPWEAAETYCQSTYGTHLATIWDDDAARELLTYTPTFWIGLNDRNVEGTWEYADGSNSLCGGDCGGSYAYWHPNEPNDAGGEDCAVKEFNAADILTMVVDHPCTSEWPFACNKPSSPSTTQTLAPTSTPSTAPTMKPTAQPSIAPTMSPSSAPILAPTIASVQPTAQTSAPTATPYPAPTNAPTMEPTAPPSTAPTISPTSSPISAPTTRTSSPTAQTSEPTSASTTPTDAPTMDPTAPPAIAPIMSPTSAPTAQTSAATATPSTTPTMAPISLPSQSPTSDPTHEPTSQPTTDPRNATSFSPSFVPSLTTVQAPSNVPTGKPSATPSKFPSANPTKSPPSPAPSISPTNPNVFSGKPRFGIWRCWISVLLVLLVFSF